MRDYRILRSNGKEVVIFTTSSGVTGIVATCIPDAALAALARSLERKIRARERAEQKSRRVVRR